MPNRILKESICTSDSLNELNDFQENFFYRLIVNVDDFGRLDARPAILKARLYPLRERLTNKDIEGALRALAAVGCVEIYTVDGKPYLQLPSWGVHQTVRAKKSKFPAPVGPVNEFENICEQMQANVPVIQSNRIRNPIRESESYSEDSPEPADSSGPPAAQLPLNDGTLHPVFEADVSEWENLYPAVDVRQELRNMVGWLNANPTRRKTKSGINRFINTWLAKEQNKGQVRRPPQQSPPQQSANPFLEIAREEEARRNGQS